MKVNKTIKAFVFLLFIVFGYCKSYSQHTDKFKKAVEDLIVIDTTYKEYFYKNGALKKTGFSISYKAPDYVYRKNYGKIITFYKNRNIKSEQVYDGFGNVLSAVFYNSNVTTWWKSETLSIDTNLENSDGFFVEDHIRIVKKIKEYKYGENIGKMYLHSKGEVLNVKKSGVWKVYDQYGQIENEIVYNLP